MIAGRRSGSRRPTCGERPLRLDLRALLLLLEMVSLGRATREYIGATTDALGALTDLDDDDEDDKDKGRRKIQIEYIEEKSKRHITFSKRKAGIMKKVSILHQWTEHHLPCRPAMGHRRSSTRTAEMLGRDLRR